MTRRCSTAHIAACAVVLVLATTYTFAQTSGQKIRLKGGVMDANSGRSGLVEIDVSRWSTPAEATRLLTTLKEHGEDALLDALRQNPVTGSIRTPGQLAYELRYARRDPLPDGGSRIVLATDRRMSFWEASRQPQSAQYPFTFIQIQLNRDGEGEGKMTLATKIKIEEGNIVLENYEHQPVQLSSIKEEPLTD